MAQRARFVLVAALAVFATYAAVAADLETKIGFAKLPTAVRDGAAVRIAFELNRAADVTVAVVDGEGRVIRHLASGVLGPNAPAPFQKDSLSQSVLWDGKDDAGKAVDPAGCSFSVAAGLGMKFGRLIEWEPPSIFSRGVIGMATDEKGCLYALQGPMWEGVGGASEITVWDRDGRYLRTILPIRRDVPLAKLPGVEMTTLPTGQRIPSGVRFPEPAGVRNTMLCRDGRLTMLGPGRLVRMMTADGTAPPEGHLGPALPGTTGKRFPVYLALSPDGKTVYVSGLGDKDGPGFANVVFRAEWKDKTAEPFTAKDAKLSDPRGIATDAMGRLVVCDFNNDRLAVFNTNGALEKTLPVVGPEQVLVDRDTGAVYVYSLRDPEKRTSGKSLKYEDKSLLKFAGLDDWKEIARLDLPKRGRQLHDAGPIIVLDKSAKEPLIYLSYVGRQEPEDYLWKVADRGATFERVQVTIPRYHWPFGRSFSLIHLDRKRDELYLGGRSFPGVLRVDLRTGNIVDLTRITKDIVRDRPAPTDHPQVTGMDMDADGRLYLRLMGTWSGEYNFIRRYDREGNRVPFAKVAPPDPKRFPPERLPGPADNSDPKNGNEFIVTQASRGYHSGHVAVAPNGDIHVIEKAVDAKTGQFAPGNANSLNVYSSHGELKKTGLIPWLSAAAWGPRFDRDGNILITDAVRPNDPKIKSETTGSVVRYGPSGGTVNTEAGKDAPYVTRRDERDFPPVRLEGAHWVFYGVGVTPFGHCVCSSCPFDVDGFGRSFVPDKNRFRIMVVDSGGNFVTTFGEYGNRDSRGPASKVREPELPIGEPYAVAVSDRAVYVYDRWNHRILEATLTYAAQEHCRLAQ